MYDLSLSSEYEEFEKYYTYSDRNIASPEKLYEAIFAQDCASYAFTNSFTVHTWKSEMDQKIQKAFLYKNAEIIPMAAGGSATLDATISWGGSEGTTGSMGFTIEGHDDNGNQYELSVQQNSNGEGSVTLSATVGDNENQ